MACDGSIYEDGIYYGICPKEKVKRSFYGVVRTTETGRVVVEGPCDTCGTLITKVLCSG
jgi:hypothetical protein